MFRLPIFKFVIAERSYAKRGVLRKVIPLLLMVLISSCKKFLAVDPPSSKMLNETVFDSDIGATSALVGVYLDMYKSGFASGDIVSLASLGGLSADELHYISLQPEQSVLAFEANSLLSNNVLVSTLWTSMYKAIYQMNAALESLDISKGVTQSTRKQLQGEALFIRAFCHFYLVNCFGDIPIVTTTDYRITSQLGRISELKVYEQIEADLLKAEDLLPENYLNGKRIRPVKAVATALLARLYLYREEWAKAEFSATKLINNVAVYTLEGDLNNVFVAGSHEAIWQLKPADDLGITNEGHTFSPAIAVNNNVLSETLISSFGSLDKRRLNWITSAGTLNLPYKYKLHIPNSSSNTEYSMVFRLAEQYLIRAEARARQGFISGNAGAESDVNAVRHRAGLPFITINSLHDALSNIENERKLELFTEWAHRWFDLKRWNRATEVLASKKLEWTHNDVFYPIPQGEMNRNPFLKPQNQGY